MEGFILNLNRVKDEDLIVTILTKESLVTTYRFYGARHGTINLGFKIDFEQEYSQKSTIDRLKDVIHIGYRWIGNHHRMRIWQEFCLLLGKHLRDATEVDEFYFALLEESSSKWEVQNPKRIAIEAYIKILEHEGRLHKEKVCFLCSLKIDKNISLVRSFLPTHKECSHSFSIDESNFYELMNNQTTLFLSNAEIDQLWIVLTQGF